MKLNYSSASQNDIYEITRCIRKYVNKQWKHNNLIASKKDFYKTCACMDVLSDTQCAIDTFKEIKCAKHLDLYLFIYGVLQAMFMQQDAVKSIAEALNVNIGEFKKAITDVRNFRNDLEHPTERSGKYFIQLEQISMTKSSLRYWVSSTANGTNYKDVNLAAMLTEQEDNVSSALKSILAKLENEFITHCDEHRGRKMIEIFDKTEYPAGKLSESDVHMHIGAIESIEKALNEYENEIDVRYGKEDTYRGMYELKQIRKMCEIIKAKVIDEEICEFLREHVKCKWDKLRHIAQEIDDEFQTYDKPFASMNSPEDSK